jgi:hypothetical protein
MFLTLVAGFLAVAGLMGCTTPSKTMQGVSEGEIPEWYTKRPVSTEYLYEPATAVSQDLQLGVEKATMTARTGLARQVETKVSSLQKSFMEETGTGTDAQLLQQFSTATKNVVNTTLVGTRAKQQEQFKEGDMWRVYVLMEYPLGAANSLLMQAIRGNAELLTRYQGEKAFQALEQEVQKYESKAKEEAPR